MFWDQIYGDTHKGGIALAEKKIPRICVVDQMYNRIIN